MTLAETGEVQFGRRQLRYAVVRSARRRTVSISVGVQGVTVKAPPEVSGDRIAELVRSRGAWVISKQLRFATLHEVAPRNQNLRDGAALRYLGRQCRLWRSPELLEPRRIGRRIEVPLLADDAVPAALEQWYRQQAQRVIGQRVGLYARRLGVTPSAVLIRDQRTRWGSCNSKGELRFNWRIVMAPMSLIDYVVAHELCHLEHLNHGPEFWQCLRDVLPDYEQRRERLALEGAKYVF